MEEFRAKELEATIAARLKELPKPEPLEGRIAELEGLLKEKQGKLEELEKALKAAEDAFAKAQEETLP